MWKEWQNQMRKEWQNQEMVSLQSPVTSSTQECQDGYDHQEEAYQRKDLLDSKVHVETFLVIFEKEIYIHMDKS